MREASKEWGTNLLIGLDFPGVLPRADGHTHHYKLRFARWRDGQAARPLRQDPLRPLRLEYVPLGAWFPPGCRPSPPTTIRITAFRPAAPKRAFPWTGGPITPIRSASPSATRTPTRIGRGPTADGGRRPPADFLLQHLQRRLVRRHQRTRRSTWPSAASAPVECRRAVARTRQHGHLRRHRRQRPGPAPYLPVSGDPEWNSGRHPQNHRRAASATLSLSRGASQAACRRVVP